MAINIGIKIGTPKAFVPPPPPPLPPLPGPEETVSVLSTENEEEIKPKTRRRTTSI